MYNNVLLSPRAPSDTFCQKHISHFYRSHFFTMHKMSCVMSSRDKCGDDIRHASQSPNLHPRGTAETGILQFTGFFPGFNDELALLFSRTRRSCCSCIIKFHLTSFIAANVPVTRHVWGHNHGLFGHVTELWLSLTFLPFILETLVRIPRLLDVFRLKVPLTDLLEAELEHFSEDRMRF